MKARLTRIQPSSGYFRSAVSLMTRKKTGRESVQPPRRIYNPKKLAEEQKTKTVSCASVNDEKSLEAPFAEGITYPFGNTLRHWLAKQQHSSLETFMHRAEALLYLQRRRQQKGAIIIKQSRYWSAGGNTNTRKRQVMKVKRSSPP